MTWRKPDECVVLRNTIVGVLPVKITVGVSSYDGERIARLWGQEPKDVVDAHGRPCKQVETEDHLIAVEWLRPSEPPPKSKNPFTSASSVQACAASRCSRIARSFLQRSGSGMAHDSRTVAN